MSGRPVWVVVADPLTARTFFDCGIVDGLAARLGGRLVLAFSFRREEADVWAARVPARRRPCSPTRSSSRRRWAGPSASSGAPTGGSTRVSATTRSRSGSTCGTASIASGCCRGTGTSSWTRAWSARSPCDRPSSARCAAGTSASGATSRARFGPGSEQSDPRSSSRTCRCSRRRPSSSRPAGSASRRSATSRAGTTPSARG